MLNTKIIDDIARQVTSALPGGGEVRADLERNVRAAVRGVLGRMDLVTREDFDVQSDVLARTRSRLEELERRVAELESRVLSNAGDDTQD
jgi:BMFP domain-containing protein YqiC